MARQFRTSDTVERTRTWAGVSVVVAGDVAIAAASAFMVFKFSGDAADVTQVVAVLTSAFTAIGTMTTAFFGIRAVSNTAQSAVAGAGEQAVATSQQSGARPLVSHIEPTTGAPAGDEDVTITGSGFTRDAIVAFGHTTASSVCVSNTQIKAKSPAGAPGQQLDVTVETPGGISDTGPSTKFTYKESGDTADLATDGGSA